MIPKMENSCARRSSVPENKKLHMSALNFKDVQKDIESMLDMESVLSRSPSAGPRLNKGVSLRKRTIKKRKSTS